MNSTNDTLPGPKAVIVSRTQRQLVLNGIYAIPVGGLIGWLVGTLLDRHFHTGWIAIAGIVVGAAAGFLQIIKISIRYMKNNQ